MKKNEKHPVNTFYKYLILFICMYTGKIQSQIKFISEHDSLCNINQFMTNKIEHYITAFELHSYDKDYVKLPPKDIFVKNIQKTITFDVYTIGGKPLYISSEDNCLYLIYKKKIKIMRFNTPVKFKFIGYLKRENCMEFKFKVKLPKCNTFISLNDRNDTASFYSLVQYDFGPE